jgi:hypothetical protein
MPTKHLVAKFVVKDLSKKRTLITTIKIVVKAGLPKIYQIWKCKQKLW